MADLAVVFHWGLGDMQDWSLAELMAWHERARVRSQPGSGPGRAG